MNFNKTRTGGFLAVIIGTVAMVGCVSASVNEPSACDSKSVSFPLAQTIGGLTSQLPSQVQALAPQGLSEICNATSTQVAMLQAAGLPSTYQLAPQTTSTTFDFSDDISKIDSVAKNLNVQITQLLLDNTNNEFGFVSSVEVDMQGADAAAYPSVKLASYTAPEAGTISELNVDVALKGDQIIKYLSAGQVQLTITLNSNPVNLTEVCALVNQANLDTTAHMCVAVSGDFSKSL